jgi:uncharacterized protein YjgD (DUF1641 family)
MEYKVIQNFSAEELTKAVNEHLKDGWELNGNLCMSVIPRGNASFLNFFAQAMTKQAKPTRPLGTLGLGSAKRK